MHIFMYVPSNHPAADLMEDSGSRCLSGDCWSRTIFATKLYSNDEGEHSYRRKANGPKVL